MAKYISTNFTFSFVPQGGPTELGKELSHDIVAAPVFGFRSWRVMADPANPVGPMLAGVGVDAMWGQEAAECLAGLPTHDHGCPDANCYCGYWLLKDEDKMADVWHRYRNQTKGPWAYGTAQAWGRVIDAENGYRAQHARPVDVKLVDGTEQVAQMLRDRYGCQVELVELPDDWRERQYESFDSGSFIPSLWTHSIPIHWTASQTYDVADEDAW
jgi:hypothetical protein